MNAPNGVTKELHLSSVLGIGEENVMRVCQISTYIEVWVVCLPDEAQSFLREIAVSAETMNKGGASSRDVLVRNWGQAAATSGLFVRVASPHILVDKVVCFKKKINAYARDCYKQISACSCCKHHP